MPPIDPILWIEGLVIQRIERAKNIHVWANTQRLSAWIHCPVLKALYFAKQQLNGLLVLKTVKREGAKRLLPKFLKLIRQLSLTPTRALADTLTSRLEPILAMWRFSESNASPKDSTPRWSCCRAELSDSETLRTTACECLLCAVGMVSSTGFDECRIPRSR